MGTSFLIYAYFFQKHKFGVKQDFGVTGSRELIVGLRQEDSIGIKDGEQEYICFVRCNRLNRCLLECTFN